MKRLMMKSSILAALCCFVVSGVALALPSAGDKVTVRQGVGGANQGGSFILEINGTDEEYLAFCLERDETVYMSVDYAVDTVQDEVTGGGVNTDGGDLLSDKTQWLFYTYAFNRSYLFGITGGTESELANNVQLAIWLLEDELVDGSNLYGAANTFFNSIISGLGAGYDFGIYNDQVTAVNLVTVNLQGEIVECNQSMIVADPVPEPATLFLFGTGIAGLAGFARRKRS